MANALEPGFSQNILSWDERPTDFSLHAQRAIPYATLLLFEQMNNKNANGGVSDMESTSTLSPARLTARRGDYGIDAPYVLRQVFVSGLVCLALGLLALVLALLWWRPLAVLAIAGLLGGLVFLLVAAGYLYTTRLGKFRVWEELLAGLSLRGDEQVLDL